MWATKKVPQQLPRIRIVSFQHSLSLSRICCPKAKLRRGCCAKSLATIDARIFAGGIFVLYIILCASFHRNTVYTAKVTSDRARSRIESISIDFRIGTQLHSSPSSGIISIIATRSRPQFRLRNQLRERDGEAQPSYGATTTAFSG